MKLSHLLSDVLDGQKLVDNMPDEAKPIETKKPPKPAELIDQDQTPIKEETPTAKPIPKKRIKKVAKEENLKTEEISTIIPALPELPPQQSVELKQKHDEEIAAKIKAQISSTVATAPAAPPLSKPKEEPNASSASTLPVTDPVQRLKAQIKEGSVGDPYAKHRAPMAPPSRTMSIPDPAKLRELTKQARNERQVPPTKPDTPKT